MGQNSKHHQVLSLANEHPACDLATVENDQPRVRGMLMWYADETGFYFHTSSKKELATQLVNNPKVEVAFLKSTDNPAESAQLRVCGIAEIIKDKSLEERLIKERPWLKEFEKAVPGSSIVLFRISKGEAHIWDMSVNMHEETIERVKI